MAAKKHAPKKARPSELLAITAGHLGPVGAASIGVQPLTVLIGRQGTGKSLVAQMLYFFRGLPSLVRFDAATDRSKEASDPRKAVRRIVDGMRSAHRSFARLTVPSAALRWEGSLAVGGVHAKPRTLTFNVQNRTSHVNPGTSLTSLVEEVQATKRDLPHTAVFVPTERLLYAMGLGATGLQVLRAPLILRTFAQMMDLAGRIQSDWIDGNPDTEQGEWIRQHLRQALGGEAHLRGAAWRWEFHADGARRTLDLDMASSGQRANWPLSIIPQILFSLRASGELAEGFTLYVEEPEIHLHPGAERAVVEVIAYLVNNGIRVVLTTHSLTVLYTLNNLLLANALPQNELVSDVPPEIRLRPEDVAAYHLHEDGRVESLVSDQGTISERALGSVADELSLQMNRIVAKQGPPA